MEIVSYCKSAKKTWNKHLKGSRSSVNPNLSVKEYNAGELRKTTYVENMINSCKESGSIFQVLNVFTKNISKYYASGLCSVMWIFMWGIICKPLP